MKKQNKKNGMMDYVGKYRVVCDFDRVGLKPNKDDTWIYCAGEGQINRFNDDVLMYYIDKSIATRIINSMQEENIELIANESGQGETCLKFYEKDLDVFAEFVKARKSGTKITPVSKRNLRLFKWYKNRKKK